LGIDWGAFYWVPSDIFGNGKVLVFGNVIDKDGTAYSGDLRGVLKHYADEQHKKNNYTLNAATEIEGFLFAGKDANAPITRPASSTSSPPAATTLAASGPAAPVHRHLAEVQRAMASRTRRTTRKSPPASTNQLQLLRSGGRGRSDSTLQAAHTPDCQQHGLHGQLSAQAGVASTAAACNTNVSVSKGKTISSEREGRRAVGHLRLEVPGRILTSALDLCLVFNSSVNAYRAWIRHFEAPNQIRASAVDRGAMVRVPIGNHRSMRTEVRAVAPTPTPISPSTHLQDRPRRRNFEG